jgi:hypothetical protein
VFNVFEYLPVAAPGHQEGASPRGHPRGARRPLQIRGATTRLVMGGRLAYAPVNCKSLIYLLSFRRLHTSPT